MPVVTPKNLSFSFDLSKASGRIEEKHFWRFVLNNSRKIFFDDDIDNTEYFNLLYETWTLLGRYAEKPDEEKCKEIEKYEDAENFSKSICKFKNGSCCSKKTYLSGEYYCICSKKYIFNYTRYTVNSDAWPPKYFQDENELSYLRRVMVNAVDIQETYITGNCLTRFNKWIEYLDQKVSIFRIYIGENELVVNNKFRFEVGFDERDFSLKLYCFV